MKGWQELWHDPDIRERWEAMPPLPEVVEMADRLEGEKRRRVLDIGCGLGRHTVYLAARGFEVTATDNAPAALAACKANLEEAGLTANVIETEMTDYPFPDGHFEGALGSHVIHHTDLATLKKIIASITRVLDDDGYFAWATPTPRHKHCGRGAEIEPGTWVDPNHPEGPIPHHYSTEEEVRGLLHAYDILSIHEHEWRESGSSTFHWRLLARKRATQ
ncbi:MAG TPA: methyltransferase domain-containing protein [Armatimonadota bacterium]|nr:methyltransferase domain-containing protein [Armatimonadota bacterium]